MTLDHEIDDHEIDNHEINRRIDGSILPEIV